MSRKLQHVQIGTIAEDSDGYLIYCENGVPTHAGVVRVGGKIYYAGQDGLLVCGHHKTVHRERANGLLKRGIYEFGTDGVLIEGSYRKPEKKRRKNRTTQLPRMARQLIIAGIVVLLITAAVIAVTLSHRKSADNTPDVSAAETGPSMLELPPDGELVFLCSPAMQSVYTGSMTLAEAVAEGGSPAQPYVFRYALDADASAVLTLDGRSYRLDPGENSLEIWNLETNRTYQYSVTATKGDETRTVSPSFQTADTNRFLSLTGVRNVRDIGGCRTQNGNRIAEGMIIRGGEIDGLMEPDYKLEHPEEAAAFRFRYDFDLRPEIQIDGAYFSPLGASVGHKFYSSPMYGEIFQEQNFPALRQIFSDLADPDKYPMYLHCTYGADRTGTIVFLLQGILGVSEKNMRQEYALTGFSISGYETCAHLERICNGLDVYPGKTINEKIESFLVNTVGVPRTNLASIRSILLES